jgi:hypothetical protein
VVNVPTAVRLVTKVKFGALVVEPPVVPKVYVLAVCALAVNPPVPVHVNPVAVAIDNAVCAAKAVLRVIAPVPKLITRVLVLDELKIPVCKVNVPNANVPLVNVVVSVLIIVRSLFNVQVPPIPLKVIDALNVTALVVIV